MAATEVDSAYLRQFVLDQAVDSAGAVLFETQLSPMAQIAGPASIDDRVSTLRVDSKPQLHRAEAEARTINETSFFRDVKPFEALRSMVLPALIRQKQAERRLRIWSAACSTGQEAYSVAMLLLEHFGELREWDVQIIGTDVSQHAISYAREGRYRRIEINRGLPARMLLKYFKRHDEEWQVNADLCSLCDFRYVNLAAELPELPVFDLVLMRNVLLYFPQQDRSRVLSSVYQQMNPKGYLLLGDAEQAEDSTDHFEANFLVESYFYRPVLGS